MANEVARAIEQVCFAVEETIKGTAVFPSDASQMIVTAGVADINQQPTYTDSEEINDSLDLLERFQDKFGAGQWSIPFYLRPSGTAGTSPMGKVLLESLMGLETVVASTSVTYGLAKTKPSFTVWMKKGHTVFFGTGACAENGKLNLVNKGACKLDFSGGFMKMGWAGTDTVNGAVSASTSVVVSDAKKFTAGAYVQIGTDNNSGAGYKIDSVNYTTNTLTMVDSITCDDAVEIKGYLPSYAAVGVPLENKKLGITFDGSSKNIKSLSIDINSPVEWQDQEISSSDYVEEYIENRRSINCSLNVLFRQSDLSYFYNATQNTKTNIVATITDGAGKICTINLPYTELEVPRIQTPAPAIDLDISGTALGSSGEDSCSIVFT